MRIGRILLIVGLILILGALAVGGFFFVRARFLTPAIPDEPFVEGTPVPEVPQNMVQIVVAAQNIPRGLRLTEDINAVTLQNWPLDAVPVGAFSSLEETYDRIARTDVQLGMPVLDGMLTETAGDLAAGGSEIALQIPPDMVAYAVPVSTYSSAAWALRPGDRIDIMMSMLVVDLDEEFQSILPNDASCISPSEDEGCRGGILGRFEVMPNGWLLNIVAKEQQRPRLVTQLAVQDALVLHVGEFERIGQETSVAEEGAAVEEAPAAEEAPIAPEVEPILLAVSRQDAMVLEYSQALGARLNAVLRSAGDGQTASTESVTLQYLMDRFNIELPPKLPYGVTPPVTELERVARSAGGSQYGGTENVQIQEEP